MRYHNWGDIPGQVLQGGDSDLSIVLESPFPNRKLFTADFAQFLNDKGVLKRLRSIHVVYPDLPVDGKIPLARLRKGWERCKAEVADAGSKRALVLGSTHLLKVMFPGANLALPDAHGTIFTIRETEYVPTWRNPTGYILPYFLADIERYLTLYKPNSPLAYYSSLDNAPDWPKIAVVDLETTGLDTFKDEVTTVAVQWGDELRALAQDKHSIDRFIETLIWWAQNGTHFVFHNAQFDLGFMPQEFRDAAYGRIHCTLIRSKARGELVNSLKHLGIMYTDRPGNYAWANAEDKHHDFNSPSYVCEDLEVTWQLMKKWILES